MILDYTINEVWNLLENIEEDQIKETRPLSIQIQREIMILD